MPRVILTLLVLGLVIYLLVRLVQGRGGGGGGGSRQRPPSVAPDDDASFLRDLDDKLWQDRQGKPDPD